MSQGFESQLVASVVVPVWNGAGTLGRCLDALAAQTVERQSYEVIVVDDGSTDASLEAAARQGVTVLCQEHAGAAAARNRGARWVRAPFLLFTDADCEPQADWIEQMVAPFADVQVMGVKGVYRSRQSSLVARFTQAEYEEKYRWLRRRDQIDFVDTHAAAYRADVFAGFGGFDQAFVLDEDQEFSFRLAGAGCKLVFAPGAVVYHQHPDTVWCYFRRKVRLGCWKVPVLARHPGKLLRDSYTPWTQRAQVGFLLLAVGSAIAALVGVLPRYIPVALVGLGLASSLPLIIQAKKQGWAVAAVAPLLILLRAIALAVGMVWGVLYFAQIRASRLRRAVQ